jgi:hypothetical protein
MTVVVGRWIRCVVSCSLRLGAVVIVGHCAMTLARDGR